ncbi:MAG: type II 3-dehydroquinate dehydratase, partial [Gemmatimonadetes bacterium]|nr:type II 3-dehydroquinate dehydratase [Gemmatimonadota bacterium]
ARAGRAAELGAGGAPSQPTRPGPILSFLAAVGGRVAGGVVNPAGLGHTSVALLDGLLATAKPFVEVHLSNPASRERFRRHSYLTPAAVGVVAGFGVDSYVAALHCLVNHLRRQRGADPGETPPGRG